jgi:hypothetical protein
MTLLCHSIYSILLLTPKSLDKLLNLPYVRPFIYDLYSEIRNRLSLLEKLLIRIACRLLVGKVFIGVFLFLGQLEALSAAHTSLA